MLPAFAAAQALSWPSPHRARAALSRRPAPSARPSMCARPAGMNPEWYEALRRLQRASPGASLAVVDSALDRADGDEMTALEALTSSSGSALQLQREETVRRARAAGDDKRVSAVKEAELRRIATGSARDYFKGFVEVKGDCVEQGMVDEEADVMAKAGEKLKSWFGGGK